MMSDKDIRKGFQSKFSGFEAPVPPDGWENLERSLKATAVARTALRRRWYAGSVAAVLVLLVGSILFLKNPMEESAPMVSGVVSTPPTTVTTPDAGIETAAVPESFSEPVARTEKSNRLFAARTPGKPDAGKERAVSLTTTEEMMDEWLEREELEMQRAKKEKEDDAIRALSELLSQKDPRQSSRLYEEEVIIVGGDDTPHPGSRLSAERGEGTLLLAVNARGGLSGYQQTVNSPMTLRSASVNSPTLPEEKYLSEAHKMQVQMNNTAGNVSEMEHDQPVSFGITVSKYLFDDLSIETGLVYSYLHSKTRNINNNFKAEEVQKLHYLGIPLNVNYNILSFGQMNVYASIGGMIEKDVYGEYRRVKESQGVTFNNASGDSEENEAVKISQKNPQLSVNAGVGISYPLYDKLRLYGKVGGAYYFDTENQYKTIYSDRKIVMDLNVGLRYEF